ncbi:MAG: hypothetical protein D6743_01890, partial [Calditrichaeota bacterium]
LAPGNLGERPYVFTPEPETPYPLALISPASAKLISSTLGEFNLSELHVTLNPADALPRDIKNGDLVRVFNHLGEVQLSARLSDRVRPGVVMIPKGGWRKSTYNGFTATVLTPDSISSAGGGACFNDARVDVEKALSGAAA